jgi:hypothetical protein
MIASVRSTATQALIVGSPVKAAISPMNLPPSACAMWTSFRLAIDELDETAQKHVERHVAHGVVVQHLAGLERPRLAALPEPLELRVRKPREDDLVVEIREALAANDVDGRTQGGYPARKPPNCTFQRSDCPDGQSASIQPVNADRTGARGTVSPDLP